MTGFFGIGIWHTKTEANVGTLMRTAHSLGAAFVYTIGRRYHKQASDTTNARGHIPLYHYDNVASLKNHLPHSCPLVGVELHESAIQCSEFAHPRQACYLLGAEDHGLSKEIIEACHRILILPGQFCHNVAVAGGMVLYDRHVKGFRNARSKNFYQESA